MARKVQVILSDDLDENLPADETGELFLDGTYEIDLADKNAKEMRDGLLPATSRPPARSAVATARLGGGRSARPAAAWTASRPVPFATGPARTVTP